MINISVNSLNSFVGQEKSKELVSRYISLSMKEDSPFPHTLLSGGPGYGKTTFAKIISKEMGRDFIELMGPKIVNEKNLSFLKDLKENTIVFIDEIHSLNSCVQELLYPVMEECKMYENGRTYSLPRITIIGATTSPHSLSRPFLDRFTLNIKFNEYSKDDLRRIIDWYAGSVCLNLTKDATESILALTRNTPRVVRNMINNVNIYKRTGCIDVVESSHIYAMANLLGINESGLNVSDRKYLEVLYHCFGGGPIGINALAAVVGETKEELIQYTEPYLIKSGYIILSKKGRVLTSRGKSIVC